MLGTAAELGAGPRGGGLELLWAFPLFFRKRGFCPEVLGENMGGSGTPPAAKPGWSGLGMGLAQELKKQKLQPALG